MSAPTRDWKTESSDGEKEDSPCTPAQRRLLNAACDDLAKQIKWHSFKLSKNDWRHTLAGTVLGWRIMPGIDKGEGVAPGLIMLGGSSLDLKVKECGEAIEMAFAIGDHPEGQGLNSAPVRWCEVICKARWIQPEERAA